MARVLLDSTVLIDALRGRPAGDRLRTLRRQGDEPWTCAICGITLHQADCLIAAAATGIDARLATGNPDDFPMRGITVEHWPVGR